MNKTYKFFGIPIFSKEERSSIPVSTGSVADPSQALINALNNIGGNSSSTGIIVNSDTMLGLSAVWRAINVISSTLAGLPLKTYRFSATGRQELKTPAAKIIRKPNNFMTGFIFRETLQAVALGFGNGYAYIKRNESTGEPIEMVPVHPTDVMVFKDSGKLWYMIRIDNATYTVPSENMIHIPGLSFNGLVGFSPISIARESLEGAIATQRFGNKFFSNGGNIGSVLEVAGELTDAVYNRLKSSWQEKYIGLENSNSPAILEGGTKFSKITVAPEDAQFIQTRNFHVSEIARWFGVPPHLLMDLERSTNNNIEHQGMEFVQYTLLPWANRWEEELSRKLIKSSAQDSEYFEYEFNGLMRADAKSRAEFYKGLFAVGAISPAKIAELENLPAPVNGEQYYVQAGFAPTDSIGEFYKNKGSNGKANNNG